MNPTDDNFDHGRNEASRSSVLLYPNQASKVHSNVYMSNQYQFLISLVTISGFG